ncbi:DUF192 domain-containing protein [Novosphingobium huizhouense]|uniref:DUF192 domain-containing protein n=1 Tax=Novosphingobium huizhouense TaxID=2866625 RepID=UPI001CD855DE|nr:DUF192 domain-containing protein [Novosphingobium huizhouense]
MACSPADARQRAAKPAAAPAAAPASAAAAAPAAPQFDAKSHLRLITLTVATAPQAQSFTVEVASTPAEQAKGLMNRTEMDERRGMIFPFDPPQRTAFWMKNTILPLDIIFIGADHRVLNVAANAVPYDLTPLPSAGPAAAVLELNAGLAAKYGIVPGTLVEW